MQGEYLPPHPLSHLEYRNPGAKHFSLIFHPGIFLPVSTPLQFVFLVNFKSSDKSSLYFCLHKFKPILHMLINLLQGLD